MVSFKLQLAFLIAQIISMVSSQGRVPASFQMPATRFNRGGRVAFRGLNLGQVCQQIVLMGGKDALSDGMGAASKWFSTQKMSSLQAGGTDPQMQCLFAQATGSRVPGMLGNKDPGNIFGDYYDTIIEYPFVDPCGSPQCNGQVNPTVLLMRKFGRAMMGRGGMGGMMGGMGGAMGGAMNNVLGGGMQGQQRPTGLNAMYGANSNTASSSINRNPSSFAAQLQQQQQQNILLQQQQQRLQQQQQLSSPMSPSVGNPVATINPQMPAAVAAHPTTMLPSATTAANPMNGGANMLATVLQNPKLMEMFQQFVLSNIMKGNLGQANTMNSAFPGMSGGNQMMQRMNGGLPMMNGGFPGFL